MGVGSKNSISGCFGHRKCSVNARRSVTSRARESPPEPWDQHDGLPLPFYEARAQRVGQAIAVLRGNRQTIHDHERLRHLCEVEATCSTVSAPSSPRSTSTPSARIRTNPIARRFSTTSACFTRPGKFQGEGHLDGRALGQGEHAARGTRHGVGAHLVPALRAIRAAHPRPKQPEVVVDLSRRSYRGATGLGGILLLDGHGGRDPLDRVDVGFLHPLEKLLRVGGERLDVPALPLGEQRVEGQRGLTGARGAGDYRESPPGVSRYPDS